MNTMDEALPLDPMHIGACPGCEHLGYRVTYGRYENVNPRIECDRCGFSVREDRWIRFRQAMDLLKAVEQGYSDE